MSDFEIGIDFELDEIVQILTLALQAARVQEENNEDNLDVIDELTDLLNRQEAVNENLVKALFKLGQERNEARRWARIFYKRFLAQLPNVVSRE